ncbi:hypothetical protein YC2023_051183 [Brassica napus]
MRGQEFYDNNFECHRFKHPLKKMTLHHTPLWSANTAHNITSTTPHTCLAGQQLTVHTTLVHNSPVHNSPIYNSPIHISPVHNSPDHNSVVVKSPSFYLLTTANGLGLRECMGQAESGT